MAKRKKIRTRKAKSNKYDNLSKPEDEFDYHDRGAMPREEILRLTDEFVEKCRNRGLTKVLLITGKGLHSAKGMPVIKPMVKRYLEGQPYVARVYEGRRDRGGSGTLEVIFQW